MSIKDRPTQLTSLPDDLPPNVAAQIKKMSPASALLGLEVVGCDAEKGIVDQAFTTTDQLCNKWGGLHGGMVAAMLDDVMALCAGLTVEWGQIVPTMEMKANYIGPGRPGRLTARAETVRRGKSVIFIECGLWNEDGSLVATATSTFTVVTLKKKDAKK